MRRLFGATALAAMLLGCASTTPAQRSRTILKAFDEHCFNGGILNSSTVGGYKSPKESLLPDGTATMELVVYPDGRNPEKHGSLTCVFIGKELDEALLARGLLQRMPALQGWVVHRVWRGTLTFTADYVLDPHSSEFSIRTYREGDLYTRATVSVMLRGAPSMKEALSSWQALPGADKAAEQAGSFFLSTRRRWANESAADRARADDFFAKHEAERSAGMQRAIAGGITAGVKGIQRSAEQQQRNDAWVRSLNSPGGAGRPVTPSPGLQQRQTAVADDAKKPPTKAVCKLGEARACANGFKVAAVEYDCASASAKGQADAAYRRQLTQCAERNPPSGPSLVECERQKSACRDRCEQKASKCTQPPARADAPGPGPEPMSTENLWHHFVTTGVTSTTAIGWMPSKALAEDLAKNNARNAATEKCSGMFGGNPIGRVRDDFAVYPEGCESKVEMTSTVWNCKTSIKVQCDGTQPNPAYARYQERVKQAGLAAQAQALKQAAFDRCDADRKAELTGCERACGACP